MPEKYGNPEQAALIVLTLHGELPNPDLNNEWGIKLSPAGRARLNKAGLIETRTENRRLVHKITDAGIAWCEQELPVVEAPPRTGPKTRGCFEALRRMATYLQQQGIGLLDVLHQVDEDTPVAEETLESLIHKVYDQLKTKPQDWVRLAHLRPKLNGAGKDEVDDTLLSMTRTGLVHLAPDSDRRALTDDDHQAAIRIGKEDKHLVAIEES